MFKRKGSFIFLFFRLPKSKLKLRIKRRPSKSADSSPPSGNPTAADGPISSPVGAVPHLQGCPDKGQQFPLLSSPSANPGDQAIQRVPHIRLV